MLDLEAVRRLAEATSEGELSAAVA